MVLRNAVLVGFIAMYLKPVSGLKAHLLSIDIDSICSISRSEIILSRWSAKHKRDYLGRHFLVSFMGVLYLICLTKIRTTHLF